MGRMLALNGGEEDADEGEENEVDLSMKAE